MAIRETIVTIGDEGADFGKSFKITRMNAIEADRWGRHVLQAATRSGVAMDIDPSAGMAGVAAAGIKIFAGMNREDQDDLLGRLLGCVVFLPDPSKPTMAVPLHASHLEEIETVSTLHLEAIQLHVGFFKGAARLFSPIAALLQTSAPQPEQ